MKPLLLALVSIGCTKDPSPAAPLPEKPELCRNCEVSLDQLQALMKLPPLAFDQDARGWRSVGETTCFAESASVIDAYLVTRARDIADDPFNLYFHAGQAYALAGASELAIARFGESKFPGDSPGIHWNDYVDATIAFLRHDRGALDAATTRMGAGDPNAPVVAGFAKCFDKSYEEAYMRCRS